MQPSFDLMQIRGIRRLGVIARTQRPSDHLCAPMIRLFDGLPFMLSRRFFSSLFPDAQTIKTSSQKEAAGSPVTKAFPSGQLVQLVTSKIEIILLRFFFFSDLQRLREYANRTPSSLQRSYINHRGENVFVIICRIVYLFDFIGCRVLCLVVFRVSFFIFAQRWGSLYFLRRRTQVRKIRELIILR